MLRATVVQTSGTKALKLEGKLCGPWVDEVHRFWRSFKNLTGVDPVRINLEEVSFVDARGADLLLRMKRDGASLVGCSDFVKQLLD